MELIVLGLFFRWLVIFVMVSVWVVAAHGLLLLDAISLGLVLSIVIPHMSEFAKVVPCQTRTDLLLTDTHQKRVKVGC